MQEYAKIVKISLGDGLAISVAKCVKTTNLGDFCATRIVQHVDLIKKKCVNPMIILKKR